MKTFEVILKDGSSHRVSGECIGIQEGKVIIYKTSAPTWTVAAIVPNGAFVHEI